MYSGRRRKTEDLGKADRGKKRQEGYSLLELMVGVLILTIGLFALAKMQTQAVASNSYGNQLTEATFLAQDKIEELRLLNECYLAVKAKPEISWTADDQALVDNYNSQLSDTSDNWDEIDTDSDGIFDEFSWDESAAVDHTNSDGPAGIANPIDVTGASAATDGYYRTWNVVDNRPTTKAKTVRVRVRWGNDREVNFDTVLSR